MPQQKTPNPNHSQQALPADKYQQPINAPVSEDKTPPQKYNAWQFGRTQKIAAKQAKFSKINVKNPGSISSLTTLTGTIGAGSTLQFSNTLTPLAPHANEMNYAIPYIAVYEGTAAIPTNQLFPKIGSGKSFGSYSFQGENDWNLLSQIAPGSVISAYSLVIHNNMGAAGTVFCVSQFKYLNFNSGSVM